MSISPYLFLLLTFHLLLPHPAAAADKEITEQPHCPQSFDCGSHKQFTFPYTNTTSPSCGLCMLNCSESVIKLQLGLVEYEVKNFSGLDETIKVIGKQLGIFKSKSSCEIFNYSINLPNTPSIAFTYFPNITLMKYPEPSSYSQDPYPRPDFMLRNHTCDDFIVYSFNSEAVFPPHNTSGSPPFCEFITLPAVDYESSGAGDVFSDLADEFTIRFDVSNQCRNCIKKGQQCPISDFPSSTCIRGVFIATEKKEVNPQRRKLTLILGTGVSVGFLAVVLLIYCFLRYFHGKSIKFWSKQNKSHRDMEAILKNCKDLAPNRYSYADVRKMTNSFSEKLGQGGYGEVFKGKLRNCTRVAVKILKEAKSDGEEFMNEVTSIRRTSHVNIVPLLGYCYEGRKRALIYKFMPNGSLDKFLQDKNTIEEPYLGQEKLYEISVGVAQGLEYLHRGCNTRILHLDIKPQNILLDEDFCPKISDFGLAKLCHKKESVVSLLDARGTVGYIAPEVFCRGYGGVSHKSDVYSYGMMILDMVGARKSTSDGVDKKSEIYFPDMIYKNLELVHPEIGADNESERTMMIVGLWCIQSEPSNRPAMGKVVEMLKGTIKSLPIPPRPMLSTLPRELTISTARDSLSSASVCLGSAL